MAQPKKKPQAKKPVAKKPKPKAKKVVVKLAGFLRQRHDWR